MEYYHYLIRFKDKGNYTNAFTFNYNKERLLKELVEPYNHNISFLLAGLMVDRSSITQVLIFQSPHYLERDTRIPSGKTLYSSTFNEKVDVMLSGALDTEQVTADFIKINNEPFRASGNLAEKEKTRPQNEKKIFIVHGRDDREALALQKHLKDVYNLNVIIFDDFKRRTTGKTVIEALEEITDSIGYTFIIAAPEDIGQWREEVNEWCKDNLMCNSSVEAQKVNQFINSILNTRARQNVVFEYGLFMGALGRDKVCCLLKSGTKERPSDISGVLYEEFKHSIGEKFADIVEKLKNPEIGLIR